MRICYVTNLGWPAGGAEKSIQILRQALVERGHGVSVVSTDKGAVSRNDVFADVLIPHIAGRPLRRLAQYFFYWTAYRELRRIFEDFRPDIVHIHTVGELSPAALFAAWGRPFVVTVHGPEEFTKQLIPWILPASDYRNATYRRDDRRLIGMIRTAYLIWVQRPAYLMGLIKCAAVIAPSKFLASELVKDVKSEKILQIDNGIDLQTVAGAPPGMGRLLFVGRLEAVKGVDVLLRSFARARTECPGMTLTIAGEGGDRSSYEALAERLCVADAVRFLGQIESGAVANELSASDVLVIPSVWPENLPTVAIEAMGAGRAILGSRVGGIPELVTDGVTGVLAEPYDEIALADGMVRLASQPELCRRMGEAGRQKARAYDVEAFVTTILCVYDRALGRTA